jgi:hypothetical protein
MFKHLMTAMIATLAVSWNALAIDAPPAVLVKNYIPNAIQISITPRGLKYFDTNLKSVIQANGLELEEGFFPPIKHIAEKSIPWDQMGKTPEQKELVSRVRQLLNQWLVGFNLNEVRPGFELANAFYQAKFDRLSLVTDQALLQKIGKTDGAVLAIELSVKSLNVGAESLRAWDENNQFLGKMGLDHVTIQKSETSPSLKVRLPFYVRANRNGQIEMEALSIVTNLDQIGIDVSWHKMVVPKIAIEINGNRFEFNEKELETEVKKAMPEMVLKAREMAKKFADSEFTRVLNEQLKKTLTEQLEEVNRIDPVGGETCSTPLDKQLMWGLRISKISQVTNLGIVLDAFMEDPTKPKTPFDPKMNARGLPNLTTLAPNLYDVVMTLDRGFLNRLMLHSFNRGLFSNMPLDKKDKSNPKAKGLQLLKPPTLDYVPQPKSVPLNPFVTYVKVSSKVKMPRNFLDGVAEWFVDDAPRAEASLIVKIKKIPYKGLQLSLWAIDEESLSIDSDSLTLLGKATSKIIYNVAKKQIRKMNLEWQKLDSPFTEEPIPFPPKIMEINFDISKLTMDPNGHLVMYMQYSDKAIDGGRQCLPVR